MTNILFDRRSILIAGLGSAALLSGCASSVKRTTWPDITFQHRSPIGLRVSEILFDDAAAAATVEAPARDIRYALPVSPVITMDRWAHERLQPHGGPGRARVTLTENRFVEVPLNTTSGVEGVFNIDQSERYEGALAVKVGIEGDPSGIGSVQARATASRTVPENYSLNQREETLYEMMASIVTALDERLEQEIRANLAKWLLVS